MKYQKPDKTANGRIVTIVLNHGIHNGTIIFSPLENNRWEAFYGDIFNNTHPIWYNRPQQNAAAYLSLEAVFTPDTFDYFHDVIRINGRPITITSKVYKNLIRKLSAHQVMQKLES